MQKEFALAITLRQHTPLLHFQYKKDTETDARSQYATLRATEIKPRLDNFIINQLGESTIPTHWYVGKTKKQHPALDYKLQVTASVHPVIERVATSQGRNDPPTKIASYFGDTKGITWPLTNGLILTFTSFETDLLDAIYQYIVSFFVLHNFGQRQTKGFGSFTVDKVNSFSVETVDIERILKQYYGTVYSLRPENYKSKNREIMAEYKRKNEGKDNISIYEIIHNEYQSLKAGRSTRAAGGYRKSKLFEYFVDRPSPIRWEKRYIKQGIKKLTNAGLLRYPLWQQREPIDFDQSSKACYNAWQDKPGVDKNSYRYVRALLGLAEHNEYLLDDGSETDNGKPKPASEKYLVRIEHEPANGIDIERLTSPILFKVINDNVYMIPQPIDHRIFNQKFRFSVEPKSRPRAVQPLPVPELWTPKQSEFNLLTFLDYALDKNVWQPVP